MEDVSTQMQSSNLKKITKQSNLLGYLKTQTQGESFSVGGYIRYAHNVSSWFGAKKTFTDDYAATQAK